MATKLNARSKSLKAIRDRHDKELAKIAMESWRWAEAVREPTRMVTKNRTNRRVLGVEEDVRQPRDLREARQVIELLLAGRRPRGAKKDQT